MISILTIVTLLTTFSTHLKIIWTADEMDYEIASGLIMLSERDGNGASDSNWDNDGDKKGDGDSRIQTDSSTGGSLSSKRNSVGKSIHKKNKRIKNKYYDHSQPINPTIGENMKEKLAAVEKGILAKAESLEWKNIGNLTEKDTKDLCIKEWMMQAQEISGIKLNKWTVPDCSPTLKIRSTCNNYFKVKIQYAHEWLNRYYYIDLLRCSCAYIKVKRKNIITVPGSKRFFYLHRHDNTQQYFILTIIGSPGNNIVKLVNVHD